MLEYSQGLKNILKYPDFVVKYLGIVIFQFVVNIGIFEDGILEYLDLF